MKHIHTFFFLFFSKHHVTVVSNRYGSTDYLKLRTNVRNYCMVLVVLVAQFEINVWTQLVILLLHLPKAFHQKQQPWPLQATYHVENSLGTEPLSIFCLKYCFVNFICFRSSSKSFIKIILHKKKATGLKRDSNKIKANTLMVLRVQLEEQSRV